jgi:hypothetical protein
MTDRREIILGTIADLVSDLLYYDRKNDEDLKVDEIDEAVREGEIAVDEMVEKFRQELRENLE